MRLMFGHFAKILNTTNTKILTGSPGILDGHCSDCDVSVWMCFSVGGIHLSISLYHHLNGYIHQSHEKNLVHVSGQKLHKKTEKKKLIGQSPS